MTQRVVIADAGPLIALARIEALHLLRQLFGRVCVTTTVRDEILPAKAAFADAETLVRTLAEGLRLRISDGGGWIFHRAICRFCSALRTWRIRLKMVGC